jgi:ABC-type amino acid transport substrate-binding protein
MLAMAFRVLALLFMFLCMGMQAHGQGEPKLPEAPIKVGIFESPPFVIKQGNRYTGMAVELWETMAAELGLQFRYEQFTNVRELLEALENRRIDLAVTNLTITESRAQRIDFTQPWFDSGLRVMVNDQQAADFWSILNGLKDSGHLRSYAWLAFIIFAATVCFTIFHRRFNQDFPAGWRDGLAEGFYSVMSIAASGRAPVNKNYFGWMGRIGQALWLVFGIAVLAYVTSSVTSVMTTLSLENQIAGVADLPGKTVGVMGGSTAEDAVEEMPVTTVPFSGMGAMIDALRDGEIDALIGDTPVLEYFIHTNPELQMKVVGAIFHTEKYGFGLPLNSALSRPLSVAVIGAHEDGVIETIRERYFGDSQ